MWRAALPLVVGASVLASCVSQMNCETPDGQCVESGGPTEAAVTAAAAGALWVGGGGCAIAGCRYPQQCNQELGLCEYPSCGEHRDCPAGLRCDQATRKCQ